MMQWNRVQDITSSPSGAYLFSLLLMQDACYYVFRLQYLLNVICFEKLKRKTKYFIYLLGTDFVGKTSSAISPPIKIDLTAPEKSEKGIDFAGRRHISNDGFGAW